MFDKLFEKSGDLSIVKILLSFFIISSSSVLFPLLSKQMKDMLQNNRIAQHILGILVMMSLVILYSNGEFCVQRIVMYTSICYLAFILSTKMDLQFSLMLVLSFLLVLLYQNTIKNEENNILNNNILTFDEKQIAIKNKKKYYLHFTGCTLLIVIFGTILYSNKKEIQYGGGYSLFNYLLY
jgi:hypothetical protein